MDTNGEACDIGYQENPSITINTISLIAPFQNQPEHQSRQETGEGIDLSLDS